MIKNERDGIGAVGLLVDKVDGKIFNFSREMIEPI
jgi:hypothetical protein